MKKIKFNEPYLTGKELKNIKQVFKKDQFYGNGNFTKLCMDLIEKHTKGLKAFLTDSCTSALEITALLLKNEEKNEVILPSYTFTSTASAFQRAGYKLIFAEVDPKTMMLDPEDVKKRITKKTCAIVAVHYGGYCCEIEILSKIAKDNTLYLVEDAAQAYGCELNGKAIGTFGDFGCFSFHETKNLHAGLAGALIINNPDFIERAGYIWERGTNRQQVLRGVVDKYTWVEVGGSFYPTEFQAAFLYSQLQYFDKNTGERSMLDEAYRNGLSELKNTGKLWFPEHDKNFISNYHAFFVVFNSVEDCDKARELLKSNNAFAYIGYIPLHNSPVGLRLGNKNGDLPVTEMYAPRVLRLPMHNRLKVKEVSFVCKIIEQALGK